MSLRATLTMLMSITDISAPSIAATVIRTLLPWMGVFSSTAGLELVGADGDRGAHPGAERDHRRAVETDQHRDALHHLHEVARGVVRREQREPGTRRPGEALHLPGEPLASIGVDLHRRRLSGP